MTTNTLFKKPSGLDMLKRWRLWIPFLFSILLCGLVIMDIKAFKDMPFGFPAFICFLPMVFFFIAATTSGYISALESRIQKLEGKLK
jgi:hypothetical protein